MKRVLKHFIIAFLALVNFNCGNIHEKESFKDNKTTSRNIESLQHDTAVSSEPDEMDTEARLLPIRENYNRINSINDWHSIDRKELMETTEGGEAVFYYLNRKPEKITVSEFGETFRRTAEYYLLDGELSFVFEKIYEYNRPMFYDSAAMKANGDTEIFDFQKSKIVERRSYFEDKKLFYQIDNMENNVNLPENLIEERARIMEDFKGLMDMDSVNSRLERDN